MQAESALSNENARVLVVDDQRSTTMLVCAILDRVGYRVDECATGYEAITALSRERYDLIVLDLNLSDMSGLDLLRDLKTPGLPPVVGITSGATPELLERAEAAGINRVLEKPISASQLIAAVVAAIRDMPFTEIVACGGPAIDPLVLDEIRNDNGDKLFHRFIDQALTDARQCTDAMELVSERDIA
ncbi:MAG: response regulator, partial [Acidobacteriota bacterium]|nr:response regulator [Acidobacteriota bacterium]